MTLGYPQERLFYNHIWVDDAKFIITKNGQNEAILLPEKQLKFTLLFYTLCSWEQAEAEEFIFLKIPRKEHLLEEIPRGHHNRAKNVKAFRDKCASLLEQYGNQLADGTNGTDDQKGWLSLETDVHLMDFSTFFAIENDIPLLLINYRHGADMLAEISFNNEADQDHTHKLKIDEARIAYSRAHFNENIKFPREIAQLKIEQIELPKISTQEKFRTLGQATAKKRAKYEELEAKIKTLQDSLDKANKTKEAALQTILDSIKEIKGGGALAIGMDGVGRLVQEISVNLPKPGERIDIFPFTAAENLLIAPCPFAPTPTPTPPNVKAGVGKMVLHMPNIIFLKSIRNPDYYAFQKKAEEEKIPTAKLLERRQEAFKYEVAISKESGRTCRYMSNPTTGKSGIYSRFGLRNLFQITTDLSFTLEQRLIICYLILKAYKKFSHKEGDINQPEVWFYHNDLKGLNITLDLENKEIFIDLIDRAFTSTSLTFEPQAPLQQKIHKMGGSQLIPLQRGTADYMAPEIKDGWYTEATNIYALGQVFEVFLFTERELKTYLTEKQKASIQELTGFCKTQMLAFERNNRPSLNVCIDYFDQQLKKFGITDIANLERQGERFENLPDKVFSSYRIK